MVMTCVCSVINLILIYFVSEGLEQRSTNDKLEKSHIRLGLLQHLQHIVSLQNKVSNAFEAPAAAWVTMMNDRMEALELNNEHLQQELDEWALKQVVTSILPLQIRRKPEGSHEACYISTPVFMDVPGLQCIEDFANTLCQQFAQPFAAHTYMSISPWANVAFGGQSCTLTVLWLLSQW